MTDDLAGTEASTLADWIAALDELSYYELLDVAADGSFDDVRAAFHRFAGRFHPDAHAGRSDDERAMIGQIFRRGAEAHRVLTEPLLRARYDDALRHGNVRPEELVVERGDAGRSVAPPSGPGRLVDQLRTPAARPFVARALELVKSGDPRQAKLQLVMAMHIDPKNAALEAYADELEHLVADRAATSTKPPGER